MLFLLPNGATTKVFEWQLQADAFVAADSLMRS